MSPTEMEPEGGAQGRDGHSVGHVGPSRLTAAGSGDGARLWPILITLGLVFVVLVNAVFIYIAVSGADEVVPSYNTEER